MKTDVLISKNVRLTFRLTAKEIRIAPDGSILIVTQQFGPPTSIPHLDVHYLESLCSKFYYGGYTHYNAIADILLLNNLLHPSQYDSFYTALAENCIHDRFTIVASDLFR